MKKTILIAAAICISINYGIYKYYNSVVLDLCERAKLSGMVTYQAAIIEETQNAVKNNREVDFRNFNKISGYDTLRKKYGYENNK